MKNSLVATYEYLNDTFNVKVDYETVDNLNPNMPVSELIKFNFFRVDNKSGVTNPFGQMSGFLKNTGTHWVIGHFEDSKFVEDHGHFYSWLKQRILKHAII